MERRPPLPEDLDFLRETAALLKDDEGAAAGKGDTSKRKADNEEGAEASTSSTSRPLKRRKSEISHRRTSDVEDVHIDVSS